MMNRPIPRYAPGESPIYQSDTHARSGVHKVLKSQAAPALLARNLEYASSLDANIFAAAAPTTVPRGGGSQEAPHAYLNMELQISIASRSFCDLLGVPSLGGRKLLDIVAATDRDKVYRLQRLFEDERQEREPNYLPPIYGRAEEDRVIQSIGSSHDDGVPWRTERQEVLTFQDPSGQQRSYHLRLWLAKKESTYYVTLLLVIAAQQAPMQEMYQMSSSPYPPRETGFSYRPPQSTFAPQMPMSAYPQYPTQYGEPRIPDRQMMFPQPPPLPSNATSGPGITATVPSYAQPFTRVEYSQAPTQTSHQPPRSEVSQGQSQRQSEYRLPPIQSQPGAPSTTTRGDDRGGRVDIGGLLENTDSHQNES